MAERVWEKFLTEQDKVHLALVPHKPVGFGDNPALLLIDLYRWVFGDHPQHILDAVEDWPSSCGLDAWDAVPHIQTLIQAARDAQVPIVHMTSLNEPGLKGWTDMRNSGATVERSPEAQDRFDRRGDIIDEVVALPGEPVLLKSSPSAFWGTPLMGHLNYLGIDTIITCGESTSGCVRASVVDGCTNRFRMMVVEECVFDRHQASHAINLFDMNQKYADVLPLADVLEYMASWRAQKDADGGK
jgi:nicotinamidase-related amidase